MTIPWQHNCAHDGDGWCLACVAGLEAERAALEAFKSYVHARLDKAGVPHHPNPESHDGCRIGARLDWVLMTVACSYCGHRTERREDRQATLEAMAEHVAVCEKHPLGLAVATNMKLADLLRRADECCRMLPSPASDCYTNGLQADIAAALSSEDPGDDAVVSELGGGAIVKVPVRRDADGNHTTWCAGCGVEFRQAGNLAFCPECAPGTGTK